MGCSLQTHKIEVQNQHSLDRDRINKGVINVLIRSEESSKHFLSYLKSVSYGDQLLKCYQDIRAIKELDDEQLCSRIAALVWRYKAIYDDYISNKSNMKRRKKERQTNRC